MPIEFECFTHELGTGLLATSSFGIRALWWGDDETVLIREWRRVAPASLQQEGSILLKKLTMGGIHSLFSNDCAFDVAGTPFQKRVWAALRAIPLGATESYSQVAARMGVPQSVRAVANACAANELSVLIPCHRVVRQDGQLGEYRWGAWRKRWLLEWEQRQCLTGSTRDSAFDKASLLPTK